MLIIIFIFVFSLSEAILEDLKNEMFQKDCSISSKLVIRSELINYRVKIIYYKVANQMLCSEIYFYKVLRSQSNYRGVFLTEEVKKGEILIQVRVLRNISSPTSELHLLT